MAVRYLTETFGAMSPVNIVRQIGNGASLQSAVLAATNVQYTGLQLLLDNWLRDWNDSSRSDSHEYLKALDDMIAAMDDVFDQRAVDLLSPLDRTQSINARTGFAGKADSVLDATEPPPFLSRCKTCTWSPGSFSASCRTGASSNWTIWKPS